jgi:hypothetical protein
MKKLYFLFTLLITVSMSFGQTTLAKQDFEGAGSDTWTHTPTPAVYNVSGDIWDVVTSLSSITPNSMANFWGMQDLNNANGGGAFDHTLAFPNISVSGETDILLTFYYYTIGFDSTDTIRVEFFYDDVSQGEEVLNKDTSGEWVLVSKVVPNGTTNVRFTTLAFQNGGSDYAGIDNVLLQSGADVNPSLSIVSPTEGSTVNSGSTGFDATLDVQNFSISGDDGGGMSDGTGVGFIKYSLDAGASVNKFDVSPINFTGLTSGAHSLYVELVDNAGAALSTPVNSTVNFTVNDIIQTLPVYEGFDYGDTENLGDQANWTNINSGDEVVVLADNLTYTGLMDADPSSNAVTFGGSGIDPRIEFTPVTSGTLYASYIIKVTDISAMTDVTDGGYFAYFSEPGSFNFKSRVWARPNPDAAGSTFDIGFGNASSNPPFSASTYSLGANVFVVVSYELTTGTTNIWINPAEADLGAGSAPAVTMTEVDGSPETSLSQFNIRQDSNGETAIITLDELRIGTTWADVTVAALSVAENAIDGFAIYPNPVTDEFSINSLSNSVRNVQIFNVLGKQVYAKNVLANERVNVTNLNTGIYILKVLEEGKTATRKLVIQ